MWSRTTSLCAPLGAPLRERVATQYLRCLLLGQMGNRSPVKAQVAESRLASQSPLSRIENLVCVAPAVK